MKLQQLRFLSAIVRNNLSVSAAADELFTSQPGVSHQIKLLEEELDIIIFERVGKKLTGITPAGHAVLEHVNDLLQNVKNIQQIAQDYSKFNRGTLSIATTHTQAKYVLPSIIQQFTKSYPNIELEIHQGNPRDMCKMAVNNQVDLVIATEGIDDFDELQSIPCYSWNRYLVLTKEHTLACQDCVTLSDIAQFPILTFIAGMESGSAMGRAFAAQNLKPNVIFSATDSDIILNYVEMGFGIGLVAEMVCTEKIKQRFHLFHMSNCFPDSVCKIAYRHSRYLPQHHLAFINLLAPQYNTAMLKDITQTKDRPHRTELLESMSVRAFKDY